MARFGSVLLALSALAMAAALWLALMQPAVAQDRGIAALCARAAAAVERAEGLPQGLLKAISLAETGRWDPAESASFAWPWTVTAEGRGRYLPSKAAAIAEVKALKARGIRNIDVGCLQVNLYHHPDAFADLTTAFDPGSNARYAADFLKRLHGEVRSWPRAVAHYHSRTPKLGQRYREKVLALWRAPRAETGKTDVAAWRAAKVAAYLERRRARLDGRS